MRETGIKKASSRDSNNMQVTAEIATETESPSKKAAYERPVEFTSVTTNKSFTKPVMKVRWFIFLTSFNGNPPQDGEYVQYQYSLEDCVDNLHWDWGADGRCEDKVSVLSRFIMRLGNRDTSRVWMEPQMLDVVTLAPAPDELFILYYIMSNITCDAPRCVRPCAP